MIAMELIQHRFDSIASTNDWAKEHLATFAKEALTVVTAQKQTAGRGQFNRDWISPEGKNLYTTFSFFIRKDLDDALSLTHIMAIAIAEMIEEEGLSPQIKWPNDVLIEGKKVAGILCETVPMQELTGVVIGLGLNINMSAEELAPLGRPATSLAIEKGSSYDCSTVETRLQKLFLKTLKQFLKRGFTPFLPTFRRLLLRNGS